MATLVTIIDAAGATAGARVFDQAAGNVTRGADRATKSIGRTDSGMRALGSTAGLVRTALGGVFALVTVTALIRDLSSVEDTFNRLAVVTGNSASEVEFLQSSVQSLASTGKAGISDLTKTILQLGRSNINASDSVKILQASVDATVGSGESLFNIADQTAKVLQLFGKSANEADRVLNVLAKSAEESGASVEGFLQGLRIIAPSAERANLSLDDTVAIMGLLDLNFKNSRVSGTTLAQVIDNLSQVTPEAQATLEALGLTLDDVNPAKVGLVAAFDRLRDANLSAADAAKIFTGRGFDAAQVILSQSTELERLQGELQTSTGFIQELGDASQQGLGGAFRGLTGTVSALTLGLIESDGAIADFLTSVTDGIRSLAGFDSAIVGTQENAETFARLIAGGLGFYAAIKAIELTVAAFQILKVALLSNPITLIPALLATGVGALVAFRDEVVTVGDRTAQLGDIVKAALGVIADRAKTVFNFFVDVGRAAIEFVIDIFSKGFETVVGLVDQLAGSFLPNWEKLFGDGSGALGVVKTFVNLAIALVKSLADIYGGIVDVVIAQIANFATFDFSSPFASLKRIATQDIKDIGKAFDDTKADISKNFGVDFVAEFLDAGEKAGLALTEGFQGLSGREALAAFIGIGDDFNERLAEEEGKRFAEAFLKGFEFNSSRGFIPRVTDTGGAAAPTPSVVAPEETSMISEVNAELEKRISLLDTQNQLQSQGLDISGDAIELYNLEQEAIKNNDEALLGLIERLRDSQEESRKLNEEQQKLARAQDFLTNSFADSFTSFAIGAKSAKEAAQDLIKSIIQEVIRLAAIKAFQQIFGSGGGAFGGTQGSAAGQFASSLFAGASGHGSVISRGTVQPFQRGGVVSSPTFFPLSSNRFGVAGESGEEGILPLARDSSGNLGVKSQGGGGNTVVVNQRIVTPDANSFRQSRRMIEQDLSGSLRKFTN